MLAVLYREPLPTYIKYGQISPEISKLKTSEEVKRPAKLERLEEVTTTMLDNNVVPYFTSRTKGQWNLIFSDIYIGFQDDCYRLNLFIGSSSIKDIKNFKCIC